MQRYCLLQLGSDSSSTPMVIRKRNPLYNITSQYSSNTSSVITTVVKAEKTKKVHPLHSPFHVPKKKNKITKDRNLN